MDKPIPEPLELVGVHDVPADKYRTLKDMVAGTVGGWAQVVVGHPFDTLKVRLQTQPSPPLYTSALDCFRKTLSEGTSALYKGVVSPLFGVGICNAVLFSTNGMLRNLIGGHSDPARMTIQQHTLCGALSGAVISFVNCPVEGVKVVMQTQTQTGMGGARYRGVVHCATEMYRVSGVRSLYRGFGITVVRDVPSFAAYFGTYEYLKRYLSSSTTLDPTMALVVAGGCAGIAAWIPCYPQDVVKSRIQSQPLPTHASSPVAELGMRRVVQEVWKLKGWRGFWTGFGMAVMRAFPANAATFVCYEMVIGALS
ncbi:hypothetical protein HDU85_005196 [Gaertneriomyces sp. JEL0708]|nr:hypothetical protein HDU85_005196 [Gaertneriomyces sp. JEL0708]